VPAVQNIVEKLSRKLEKAVRGFSNRRNRLVGGESVHCANSLLAVSGWPVAFSVRFFTAFVSAVFRSSIPALPLEVIDTRFRVHPYNRIVRAMLLCLLLCAKALRSIRMSGDEAHEEKYGGENDSLC
jgi:hypothetical protein